MTTRREKARRKLLVEQAMKVEEDASGGIWMRASTRLYTDPKIVEFPRDEDEEQPPTAS